MCEDGPLSGRSGRFHGPTLANEAAGGPVLRKGSCEKRTVVALGGFKRRYSTVYRQFTSGRQLAR